MERLARRGFELLGKVFSLATAVTFNLVKDRPPGSSGESGNGPYRPAPSTHSVLTSNPLVPAFLVLMFGLVILSSAPIQEWFAEGGNLPNLSQIFWPSKNNKNLASISAANEGVGVWAKKQSGFYYCQGGLLFGNQPGEMMTQDEALLSGYRPGDGLYCTEGPPREPSADSVPVRVRRWLASEASGVPSGDELFARVWKGKTQPPSLPKVSAGVGVWTKKQSGFYYCQGNILFGSKPGELMKQSDALLSGYQPADRQYCAKNKQDEASAGSLPLPTSPVR
jgi:hypothetical protein